MIAGQLNFMSKIYSWRHFIVLNSHNSRQPDKEWQVWLTFNMLPSQKLHLSVSLVASICLCDEILASSIGTVVSPLVGIQT